ncbi:unnamed protein product, partial [Iphiclides podalirius]
MLLLRRRRRPPNNGYISARGGFHGTTDHSHSHFSRLSLGYRTTGAMMLAGRVVVVAIAAVLVCCNADPHRERDGTVSDHSPDRYDANDYRQREFENFLRFLLNNERRNSNRNINGIGGSTLIGRNINGGLGGSSLLGRNLNGFWPPSTPDGNFNGNSDSTFIEHGLGKSLDAEEQSNVFARFVDPLGGSNFMRNLDSLGGGNFVRNLDSLGGSNFVKKNLDQIGGPNLVKRNLDSLGGGNFVRHKTRNLDPLGGGNLVREVRESRHSGFLPFFSGRRYDFIGPYGGARRQLWPNTEYYRDDYPKRNFDEIDRSELDSFVGKRNIDEIDQPFPYASKRFYNLYGSNYLDTPVSNFDKKRYRPDYPMDEIDLSHFPIGSKRSMAFNQNRPLR